MEMTHVIIKIVGDAITEHTRTNDKIIAEGLSNIYWLRRLGADALFVVEIKTGEIVSLTTEFREEYRRDNSVIDEIKKLFAL